MEVLNFNYFYINILLYKYFLCTQLTYIKVELKDDGSTVQTVQSE